ncbi:glycoside hydrolase [Vibrio sp. S4M6]|uniref:glycoside hydrolase n=1 Tax=Vibrio sinus TaxID=2946865 RepID=UPI00202A05F4|nr:glycoside hydrolase [Vibrio sinus]MCL9783739.1 glycoside hydrolase [Vibrio sinus]
MFRQIPNFRPIRYLTKFSFAQYTVSISLFCSFCASAVTLESAKNSVSIDPGTLAITWNKQLINQVDGPAQSVVIKPQSSKDKVSWTIPSTDVHVQAQLTDKLTLKFKLDHSVSIKKAQPVNMTWFSLPKHQVKTLILPFSEGMRVPIHNRQWAEFLTHNYSPSNTTQDLKMPFWSIETPSGYFSFQLVTATNNTLTFQDGNARIGMQASHQFTPLNRTKVFTVIISHGESILSGAKTYRQWRIDQHMTDPLTEKEKRNPNIAKLIGASMVYVFGRDGISAKDVTDWWGLKAWFLQNFSSTAAKSDVAELKRIVKGQQWFNHYNKQLLVNNINAALERKFPAQAPTFENDGIQSQYQAAQQRKSWLSQHAGKYLIDPSFWGQALSKQGVENLQKAGLKKLWIGYDNWMPAFYQPQVVKQAEQAGYLVGVYDSYNTAIPRGLNDTWLTAQLPKVMRVSCAIEQANGKSKQGFRGNGYYLNPGCQQSYVKKRIEHVIQYGHFNSYFLDVDGTGMANEDYRNGTSEDTMLASFNRRLMWTAEHEHVVLGSEDGNSLTTSGLAFAHGLETVGFGWQDKDMKSNRKSPYYLGRWFPDNKPDFFFKSAKVKQPYKTLLFAPQYRVPLYQAVFHDEVINSHHWHSDSLKFSNVKKERDLTSMLYNTPAMVHLTRDEMSSPESPRLQQLRHYQAGYLPVHSVLWDKQLVDFQWLDKQGNVQLTRFSDGSIIVANFSSKVQHAKGLNIAPMSIVAKLSNGKTITWQPM